MSRPDSEQRRFQRVDFHCTVTLAMAEDIWQLELQDLSLKGARFKMPPAWHASVGSVGQLTIELSDGQSIGMTVTVDHCAAGRLGVHWTEIDVDSLAHLRRLMELNTGDAAEINRELGELER